MFDGWGEAFALSCSRQIRLRLSGKCFHVAQPGGIGGDRRVETVPKSQEKRVRVFSPLLLAASYPALSNIPRQLPSFCYVNCFKLGPSWLRLFSIFIVFLTFSSLPSYLSNTIILVQNSRPRAFSLPPPPPQMRGYLIKRRSMVIEFSFSSRVINRRVGKQKRPKLVNSSDSARLLFPRFTVPLEFWPIENIRGGRFSSKTRERNWQPY